jgi:ribosomal protein S18 acetylase RimI-like enzyme
MFATASLAARIERAECAMLSDLAAHVSRVPPEGVVAQAIGGGLAVYTGAGSPSNKLAGMGFAAAPSAAELDAVEQAFASRGAPLQAEVSSLGDPEVLRALSGRGYALIGFENVLGLALTPAIAATADDSLVQVVLAARDDAAAGAAWMDAVATGFQHPDTFDGPPSHESFDREALDRIFADTFAAASFERYLARLDGAIAGGGSLRITDGVAQLAGAATLPQCRRRGVQSALLRYRLREAARRGCDVAVVTTQPGSKSTENVQRFGFAILYVRAILVRPPDAAQAG